MPVYNIAVNLNFFHLKKPPFIIEMAENGILDYQGMNQAIYRGATSNIVVDTQSMSIEIGAGNTSHTSNLHFECDHDANVASIKLNSNVVTEFSRSKKLIKYPRVAMTGETTSNYTVTSSSWYGSGTQYEPWKAFDNVGNHPTGQLAWYSLDYSAPEAYSGTDNAFNPSHGGTATPVLFTGAVQGEWLKIQLPHKVALDHYIMYGPNQESEFPRDWTVYGSVNGTNWDRVDSRVSQIFGAGTGAGGTATGKTKEFYLDTLTDEYLYFAFVFTRGSPNRTQYIGVGEIELYGTPEYDPEAHGVDVTIKSVPNVPNTDWLEVYYDAKDLTTMPNPVTDLAGGDQDASVYGVTLDTTNEAFVFNGSSYLETDIPQITTGVWPFTMSFWFKVNAHIGTTWNYLAHLGIRGTAGDSTLVGLQNDQISFTTWADSKINSGVVATPGVWYHVTSTWPGGAFYDNAKLYINAVSYGDVDNTRDEADPLSFPTSGNKLTLGKQMNTTSDYFNGSIANFRLFNRALTTDEIHQLYAYQKEYFGHGDLSMTLKAGRLGIGTSEPRAALDVRGDVHIGGIITSNNPAFNVYRDDGDITTTDTTIVWNQVRFNRGNCYDSSTGVFHPPVDGMYFFSVFGMTDAHTNAACSFRFQYAPPTGSFDYIDALWPYQYVVASSSHIHASGSFVYFLETGSSFRVIFHGTELLAHGNTHNGFSGFLIG